MDYQIPPNDHQSNDNGHYWILSSEGANFTQLWLSHSLTRSLSLAHTHSHLLTLSGACCLFRSFARLSLSSSHSCILSEQHFWRRNPGRVYKPARPGHRYQIPSCDPTERSDPVMPECLREQHATVVEGITRAGANCVP